MLCHRHVLGAKVAIILAKVRFMSSRRSWESSMLAWPNKAIPSVVITTSSLNFPTKVLSTFAFKLSSKSVANLSQVCLKAGNLRSFPRAVLGSLFQISPLILGTKTLPQLAG